MFSLKKIGMVFILGVMCILCVSRPSFAGDEIKVVATTKTFADLVQVVGGDKVKINYIVPHNQNVHFIQPRPSDVIRLRSADLFVHGGLDLELWRGPLLDAVGKNKFFPGNEAELDLSQGIHLLDIPHGPLSRLHGDMHAFGNPHYWMDPRNGEIMADSIFRKLSEMYPKDSEFFKNNLDAFKAKLNAKMEEWKKQMTPFQGAPIVAYHDSWPYFAEFTGIRVIGFIEPKPGISPTLRHMSELRQLIEKNQVRVIIREPYFEGRSAKKLSKETGAVSLVLANNVGEVKPAADYISMFDYDIGTLAQNLK